MPARLDRATAALRGRSSRASSTGRQADPTGRHRFAGEPPSPGRAPALPVHHFLGALLAVLEGVVGRHRTHHLFGFDRRDERRALSAREQALSVFEIEPPFTQTSLKARYKTLVKLHHPDAHGGDKAAEEKLKVINQAYATLKASYFS